MLLMSWTVPFYWYLETSWIVTSDTTRSGGVPILQPELFWHITVNGLSINITPSIMQWCMRCKMMTFSLKLKNCFYGSRFSFFTESFQKVIDFKCNYVLEEGSLFLVARSNYNDKVGNLITPGNLCSTHKISWDFDEVDHNEMFNFKRIYLFLRNVGRFSFGSWSENPWLCNPLCSVNLLLITSFGARNVLNFS